MTRMETREKQIIQYLEDKIQGIMDWYQTGAVDCPQTRKAINHDLDVLMVELREKFKIDKFPYVLRVRSFEEDGRLLVRLEKCELV